MAGGDQPEPWRVEGETQLRVRYCDCDPLGVAHHSVYPVWLEVARGELLRENGLPYRNLEQRGVCFVVARMTLKYSRPAHYDDLLRVRVWEAGSKRPRPHRPRVRLEHQYEVLRDQDLLATASTTLVCVDRDGKPQAIPF